MKNRLDDMIRRQIAAVVLAGFALWFPGPAARAEPVDLELLLAVDVSPSINRQEYILQMRGLAQALRAPTVIAAIQSLAPDGVAMALLMWAGEGERRLVVDWRRLVDRAGAEAFADAVDQAPRLRSRGGTAIGDAIRHGAALIDGNRFVGRRSVIDVSGDGRANRGIDPAWARDAALAAGLTVNGLAIRNEVPDLDVYYGEYVVGGPAAFVESASGFEDFAEAMKRKLAREIRRIGLVRSTAANGAFQTD